jgi:YidC/Oxa1 family membrane protein insertase
VGNPLNPLYEAVAWVIKHIFNVLSPVFGASSGWTWALSIVILVVLMRLIMVPLFIKQMHTTRAMTSLAPEIAALRKKYKGDKQALNAETMKLYQQAGVNPLMGCLPVVAQLPMFFALFSVLKAIAEWHKGVPRYGLPESMVRSAQHAQILGATVADKFLFTDGLKVPVHAKIVILGAVMISMATTYLTVRQSMKRGMMPTASPDNPMGQSQKYMVYIMPFFALSGLYWPFGLVLYWVTTNVWTLGQQYVLFKRYPQLAGATAGGSTGGGSTGGAAIAGGGAGRPQIAGPGPASGGNSGGSTGQNGRGPRNPAGPRGSAAPRASAGPRNPAGPRGSSGGGSSGSGSSGPAKTAKGGARQNGRGPAASGPTGKPPVTGQSSAAGGGMLRRFARGRPEPEPEPQPQEPEVKLVRQQPQRQSRKKRSGRR